MGHVLEQTGLMERLFKSFQFILAPVRGSLYLGVLLTATMFATATGIIGASVTVMGMMAAPAMIRARYDPRMFAGVITAGGCLGILIPPSVMLVVMGPVVGVSVIHLFAAALIPGVILSSLYIGYAMLRSHLNPGLGPPLPAEQRATSFGHIAREFFSGIVPLAVIVFAALGSITKSAASLSSSLIVSPKAWNASRSPGDSEASVAPPANAVRKRLACVSEPPAKRSTPTAKTSNGS